MNRLHLDQFRLPIRAGFGSPLPGTCPVGAGIVLLDALFYRWWPRHRRGGVGSASSSGGTGNLMVMSSDAQGYLRGESQVDTYSD